MYKVFIQNNPLIFIDSNHIDDFSGIYLFEQLVVSHKDYLFELLKIPNPSAKFYVICENIDAVIGTVFDSFEKVNAAGGIVTCGEKVLLMKRNGIWDLPKGKVEGDESLKEAALREVIEETGLKDVSAIKRIDDTFHIYDTYGPNTIKKTAWYIMEVKELQNGIPQKEEGIEELKWVNKSELKEALKDSYGSIQELVHQYLTKY